MKFDFDWQSGFRGEDFQKPADRRTDGRQIMGLLLASLVSLPDLVI